MAVHQLAHVRAKSAAESAVCFGCTLAGLTAFAVALQWVMGLLG